MWGGDLISGVSLLCIIISNIYVAKCTGFRGVPLAIYVSADVHFIVCMCGRYPLKMAVHISIKQQKNIVKMKYLQPHTLEREKKN